MTKLQNALSALKAYNEADELIEREMLQAPMGSPERKALDRLLDTSQTKLNEQISAVAQCEVESLDDAYTLTAHINEQLNAHLATPELIADVRRMLDAVVSGLGRLGAKPHEGLEVLVPEKLLSAETGK